MKSHSEPKEGLWKTILFNKQYTSNYLHSRHLNYDEIRLTTENNIKYIFCINVVKSPCLKRLRVIKNHNRGERQMLTGVSTKEKKNHSHAYR